MEKNWQATYEYLIAAWCFIKRLNSDTHLPKGQTCHQGLFHLAMICVGLSG